MTKTEEYIYQIALDWREGTLRSGLFLAQVRQVVQAAILAEREECARIVHAGGVWAVGEARKYQDGSEGYYYYHGGISIAIQAENAIRARSLSAPQCSLCEKGWPVEDGWHVPSQNMGMIEARLCLNAPPQIEDKPPESPETPEPYRNYLELPEN